MAEELARQTATPVPERGTPAPASESGDTAGAGRDWRAWLGRLRRPGAVQFGVLAGLAALVAVAVVLWLWAGAISYQVLYQDLSQADAGRIMEALTQNNIPYQVDKTTGALTVPADQVHEARLKLAAQGLPRGAVDGFEMLQTQDNFGISERMQGVHIQRALEGELARSVMSINAVEQARVHLALPEETVFVRNQKPRTASVLVRLQSGRVLSEGQVAAIVHLVSSSVPKLAPDKVSVVDQDGNLLTRPDRDAGMALSMDQLSYRQRLEQTYITKIERLLEPMVGAGKVRAQVALDLDFSSVETTAKSYTPNEDGKGVPRSERSVDEANSRPRPGGIPGALSNEPPGVAEAPEQVPGAEDGQPPPPTDAQQQADGGRGMRTRSERLTNYEIDETITHQRNAPGRVTRVSAAVVLDNKVVTGEDGSLTPQPLGQEDLDKYISLVENAIAFDAARGDSVEVVNAPFVASTFVAGPLPLWQEPWFLELVKLGVILLIVLLVLLLVVRPVLKRLLPERPEPPKELTRQEDENEDEEDDSLEGVLEDDRVSLGSGRGGNARALAERNAALLEQRLRLSKSLVAEDPKRAVQVLRNWLAEEAEI